MLKKFIETRWYRQTPGLLNCLIPFEILFLWLSRKRKEKQIKDRIKLDVPVLVVGNINVGGTGKTPLIIDLTLRLQKEGLKPGVISKGYGRSSEDTIVVSSDSTSEEVGDEPLLIYSLTRVPVVVSKTRIEAAKELVDNFDCDLIICDDGLQDYSFYHDIEWVVIDGWRNLGNGRALPVGPLRELPDRLKNTDRVILNGGDDCYSYETPSLTKVAIKPRSFTNLYTGKNAPLDIFNSKTKIIAIAGIGNPQKFYRTLKSLQLSFESRDFPDHHKFKDADFSDIESNIVIMTAKDAVKCRGFAKENWWQLDIEMELPNQLILDLREQVNAITNSI